VNTAAYFLIFLIISIFISVLSGIGLIVVIAVFIEELLKSSIGVVLSVFVMGALGTFLFMTLLLRLALEVC